MMAPKIPIQSRKLKFTVMNDGFPVDDGVPGKEWPISQPRFDKISLET